jgi:hypothetical protein
MLSTILGVSADVRKREIKCLNSSSIADDKWVAFFDLQNWKDDTPGKAQMGCVEGAGATTATRIALQSCVGDKPGMEQIGTRI